jgi:hypothetical protein
MSRCDFRRRNRLFALRQSRRCSAPGGGQLRPLPWSDHACLASDDVADPTLVVFRARARIACVVIIGLPHPLIIPPAHQHADESNYHHGPPRARHCCGQEGCDFGRRRQAD